jgi:hypothetical protein
MRNTLFVIGNGFDLAHRMKTSYCDFRDWLQRCAHEGYVAKMEDNLNCYGDMLWANLETNTRLLSGVDYKELFHKHTSYLTEYSTKIIDQRGNFVEKCTEDNNADNAVADLMRELFNQQGSQHYLEEELFWLYMLKGLFCEWVKSIELPKYKLYSIPHNALYLNFNYTNLLEDTYRIAPDNILHIHGNTNQEIEFGNPDLASFIFQSGDARALEVNDDINRALKSVHKNVMSIISKNQLFFSTLNKIQNVYVLGHSMNEIDEPYFLRIKENVSSSTHWTVSYHSENDRQRAEELFFNKLNIDMFEIKKMENILNVRDVVRMIN